MKLFIIGCMIFLMVGCKALTPQAQQAGDLIVQATYVDELVKSGAVTESLFNSALSDKDRKTIENSLNAYNAFTAKWGRMITKNPLEAVTQTQLIISEYSVLRIRFGEIERIVKDNWAGYPVESQYLLASYQKQAYELDELVMSMLSKQNTNTALIAVQKIAVIAGQIALKLI
jgi:hypothetical protein